MYSFLTQLAFRGHIFYVSGASYVRKNSFNPEQSYDGVEREISELTELLRDFQTRSDKIFGFRLTDLHDTGEGFDSSLRGMLELNVELIRRAEFKVRA